MERVITLDISYICFLMFLVLQSPGLLIPPKGASRVYNSQAAQFISVSLSLFCRRLQALSCPKGEPVFIIRKRLGLFQFSSVFQSFSFFFSTFYYPLVSFSILVSSIGGFRP
jgi:hypothetical protein